MTAQSTNACPCCGDLNSNLLGSLPDTDQFAGKSTAHSLHGGELFRCSVCQLKYRYPIQEPDTYRQLYDNGETSIWSGAVPRYDWDQIAQHLGEAGPDGRSVLDFGCNTGGFLARLGPGDKRFGIEINQAAAAIAAELHNAKVWSSIDEIPVDQRFDVIVAADVVEHVANPQDLIDQLISLLSERGRLIVTTGDADNVWWNRFGANWWYCFHPEHIAFLSKSWLNYLVQQSELKIIECQPFRYLKLGAIRLYVHSLFMVFYGYLPTVYLRVGNVLKKLLGRPSISNVLGNGVTADHLLIVLSRKNES